APSDARRWPAGAAAHFRTASRTDPSHHPVTHARNTIEARRAPRVRITACSAPSWITFELAVRKVQERNAPIFALHFAGSVGRWATSSRCIRRERPGAQRPPTRMTPTFQVGSSLFEWGHGYPKRVPRCTSRTAGATALPACAVDVRTQRSTSAGARAREGDVRRAATARPEERRLL